MGFFGFFSFFVSPRSGDAKAPQTRPAAGRPAGAQRPARAVASPAPRPNGPVAGPRGHPKPQEPAAPIRAESRDASPASTSAQAQAARDEIVIHSLLRQVPDVGHVTFERLRKASLGSLDALSRADKSDLSAATGIPLWLSERISDRIQEHRKERESIWSETGQGGPRDRLSKLVAELKERHLSVERGVARDWTSPELAEDRKKRRLSRRLSALRVEVMLAEMGELPFVDLIRKLPFPRRVERLEEFLSNPDAARAVESPSREREEILEKVRKGASLERADLRNLSLCGISIDAANLTRADLEGTNLEGASLRKANLASASLRDAFLVGANLEGANLQKADLEGATLDGVNLQNADLSGANLTGASLEGALLNGARLKSCQLEGANLGGARLLGAEMDGAELSRAYLGGAKLVKTDLGNSCLDRANLEASDLSDANLAGSRARNLYGESGSFSRAIFEGTNLEECVFTGADLSFADLRGTSVRGASFDGARMTGAKLAGADLLPDQLHSIVADWVDFSTHTDEVRVEGALARDFVSRMRSAAFSPISAAVSSAGQPKRFFGKGDVLRHATLEFGEDSMVEVESRLEECSIALKEGARLIIGPDGVLEGCRIVGAGEIVVHGSFAEKGGSPAIVGPKSFVVGRSGFVSGTVKQGAQLTQFGFEPGAVLRLRIEK